MLFSRKFDLKKMWQMRNGREENLCLVSDNVLAKGTHCGGSHSSASRLCLVKKREIEKLKAARAVLGRMVLFSTNLVDARLLLVNAFALKKEAASNFPSDLNHSVTRSAVSRYQNFIKKVASDVKTVCASCDLFIPAHSILFLFKTNGLFRKFQEAKLLVEDDLDVCGARSRGKSVFPSAIFSIVAPITGDS